LGDQQPTRSGKMAPHKLDRFRLTSDSPAVLQSAAKAYGGEVVDWPADDRHPKDEYQLYTTSEAIRVTIPVHYALHVSYEQWSAGGCIQRCDGSLITHCPLTPEKIGTDCECEDQQENACPRLVRFNVLLTEVSGLGVWRLESKGYYATAQLVNDMEKFQAFGLRGMMVPAWLRLASQERRLLVKGDLRDCPICSRSQAAKTMSGPKKDRHTETRQFFVPTLEFLITPEDFMLAAAERRPELLLPPSQRPQLALPAPPEDFKSRVDLLCGEETNPTAHTPASPQPANGTLSAPPEDERDKRALVNQIDMELRRRKMPQADFWPDILASYGATTKGQLPLAVLRETRDDLLATDWIAAADAPLPFALVKEGTEALPFGSDPEEAAAQGSKA
jgi:hypothetical protein